ncbi:MAG: PKD domain-containing protein [Candidatus Bathyarchaeota archaeon]|nr:PKD domain-containing protein [Candidatus Bathyarchaeota archaeon]
MKMKVKTGSRIILMLFLTSIFTFAFNVAYTTNETRVHNGDTNLHYETIQEAIDAAETLDGHTIRVDAGIYSERVSVDKSLKLVGEDRTTTIIDAGGIGTVISITASNVDISGFTLRNSGPHFDDKGISLDHSNCTTIGRNIITNNTWGIWLEYAVDTVIIENTIQNGTLGGIYLGNSTNNNIRRNTIRNNEYGIWLERSSENNHISSNVITDSWKGISLAKTADNNEVRNNTITNNDDGIHLFSSANSICENTITKNSFGIYSLHSGSNIIYRNNFVENIIKQASLNESYVDVWDNGCEGNHWSDYKGQDLNGDGIGDTDLPHQDLDGYPLADPWSRSRVFDIVWGEETYHVATFSNSTIASFNFNPAPKQINFNVTGPSGAVGFCNATVPKSLLRDSWLILVDEINSTANTIITETETHTFFYLNYGFSTHRIKIIGSEVSDESPPVADAGPDQTVDEEIAVTFDGSGSYDNIGIISYTWMFTDETQQVLTGVSPTYTFTNPSIYTILLNVSDGAGHHTTDTITITVLDVTNPIANAGLDRTVSVSTEVGFDASGSSDNVGIVSYEWTFGDGFNGTDTIAAHTYAATGTYIVKLTVRDAAGNSAIDSIIVTVEKTENLANILWIIGISIGIVIIALYIAKRRKTSTSHSKHR